MSYKFDSIVNKNEVQALKDMIFKRVRERSQSIEEDTQKDVMDMARASFVSDNNPFTKLLNKDTSVDLFEIKDKEKAIKDQVKPVIDNSGEKNVKDIDVNKVGKDAINDSEEGIGFPVRGSKLKIESQNKIINEQVAKATVASTMEEARIGLSNKKSFMGALNFLNTQAAISLVRTRADKFEILV